jgi:hypothetical protein
MTADEKADAIIATMAGGTAFIAVIPPVVDLAVFAAAIGASVVAIGQCYETSLSVEEASQMVMQFIKYAGAAFTGGKLISGLLKATGFGYGPGGALDAVLYGIMSYAIGVTAKAWFKGERDPDKLKKILREAYKARS